MKKIIIVLVTIIMSFILLVGGINIFMIVSTKKNIKKVDDLKDYKADCVLVLGASVYSNGTPSPMLEERIKKSLEVFEVGGANKFLMSGDHRDDYYDEVNAMKNYATNYGINSFDVYMDHLGLSTYDSIYRAKNIYGVKKVVIATQKYHLYRAIYIAKKMDLEVVGVDCTENTYKGQLHREIREILARVKDFFNIIIGKDSEYTGDTFTIDGDGNITNN